MKTVGSPRWRFGTVFVEKKITQVTFARNADRNVRLKNHREKPILCFQMGLQYEAGDGVTQDYQKALSCYKQAADLGHSDSMLCIGILYANGYGVEKNLKEAVTWFKLSAELGNVYAQYILVVHISLAKE